MCHVLKTCTPRPALAAAARRFRGRDPQDLPWATKIEEPGVMDLIEVDAVKERLAAALKASPRC